METPLWCRFSGHRSSGTPLEVGADFRFGIGDWGLVRESLAEGGSPMALTLSIPQKTRPFGMRFAQRTNSKKARYRGRFSRETPQCGRSQLRDKDHAISSLRFALFGANRNQREDRFRTAVPRAIGALRPRRADSTPTQQIVQGSVVGVRAWRAVFGKLGNSACCLWGWPCEVGGNSLGLMPLRRS